MIVVVGLEVCSSTMYNVILQVNIRVYTLILECKT